MSEQIETSVEVNYVAFSLGPRVKPIKAKYGRLTVLGPTAQKRKYLSVHVRCECGNELDAILTNLRRGNTTSCGCYQMEAVMAAKVKHGMTRTPVYRAWLGMRKRCENPKTVRFSDWGGRGIAVCERWLSFDSFLEDMGHPPTPRHSLDRKNNDLGYSKENCKWSTRIEQARNKRNNRLVEIDGETRALAEWCDRFKVNYSMVLRRIYRGWDALTALTRPSLNNGVNNGAPR